MNPIGAHESGLLGDDPNGIPNNLMLYICRVAASQLEKLTIFGGDYPRPDGTCRRDYLHVVDLAVGHLEALEYAENHNGVEAINLGTGNEISVLELVTAFERANNIKLPYVIGPRWYGDLPAFWVDAEKAKNLLGWEANHSVKDMCRSAWLFAKGRYARIIIPLIVTLGSIDPRDSYAHKPQILFRSYCRTPHRRKEGGKENPMERLSTTV